jgi:hypothetical protein
MSLSLTFSFTGEVDEYKKWRDSCPLLAPIPEEKPDIDATETDMVEFALGLHAARVFPGTQEDIIEKVRRFSGLPLENWVQLGQNIRQRGYLKFLDRIKNSLMERNEEIQENGRANRRPKAP